MKYTGEDVESRTICRDLPRSAPEFPSVPPSSRRPLPEYIFRPPPPAAPLSSDVTLPDGTPTLDQFHIYSATAFIVKGLLDYDTVAAAMAGEDCVPVVILDDNGQRKASVSIWFNDLKDTVVGAYGEVVCSVDATTCATSAAEAPVALDLRRLHPGAWPYAMLFPTFDASVANTLFLHSVYVTTHATTAHARKFISTPENPAPVRIARTVSQPRPLATVRVEWGGDGGDGGGGDGEVLFELKTRMRAGIEGMANMSVGLLRTQNALSVARFLCARDYTIPLTMPRKTAEESGKGTAFRGLVYKGRSPTAVRAWAWDPTVGDRLKIGVEAPAKETGAEANNFHRLASGFQPLVVTYIEDLVGNIFQDGRGE